MPRAYLIDDIKGAVQSVKTANLTISQAAREYGVPRQTLSDHVNKGLKYTPGRERMLTDQEEEALVSYCTYMASHGFPLSRKRARCYIIEIVQSSARPTLFNVEKGPSDEWFRKFISRHPELSEKKGEKQDRSRNRMSNINVIEKFYDFFEKEIDKLGNFAPESIFNCDETGWSGKESSREKIIGMKGRHTYQQQMFTSDHMTAHLCVSAAGRFIPTMLIFQGSLPHKSYKDGVPGNWYFATSDNGYMDKELFALWFKMVFVPNCGRARPVVLVMDNHGSHISIPVIELAIKESITLVGLPPHTTHILQPLDVGIIGPLKDKVATIATNLGFVNKNLVIGKAKMPVVLSHAIDQTTAFSVKEAFRKAGIYPVDKTVIDLSQIVPASFKRRADVQKDAADGVDGERTTEDDGQSAGAESDGAKGNKSLTCDRCGSFIGQNPLVKQGLIPESLAQIMLPPPVPNAANKKRKVVTEGRVISCEGILKQLKEKEEEEKTKKEEVLKRKKEREERKAKKEEQMKKTVKRRKASKNPENKGKVGSQDRTAEKNEDRSEPVNMTTMVNEYGVPYADEMYTCGVCFRRALVTDDDVGIRWVGCDSPPPCFSGTGWFHFECLSVEDQQKFDNSGNLVVLLALCSSI